VLFVIKAGIIFIVIPKLTQYYPSLYDISKFHDKYDAIAMNLIDGKGYRFFPETCETFMRSPGYVILLFGIFSLFGKSLVAAQTVNLLLSIATAYIILRLAQKIVNRSIVCWIAPLFFLFHPGIILAETRGGVESLFTFLMASSMFFLYCAIKTNKRRDYVITGIALGITLLVKSTPILFPIFILPYLIFINRKKSSTKVICTNCVAMLLTACLIYSPWVIRNYLVSGKFVFLTTIKGPVAYQGLYLNKNIFSEKDSRILLREAAKEQFSLAKDAGFRFENHGVFQYFYSSKDEIRFDKLLFNKVKQEYRESPSLFLKCILFNFIRFFFYGSKKAVLLNILLGIPLLILFIIGTYVGYKKKLNITPLLIFICAFILPHLPLLGWARFQIPLIPFLSILSSLVLLRFSHSNYSMSTS
jgi:4-amino-4-deoxy-L-arabinose transferase-like glycosyltransferase